MLETQVRLIFDSATDAATPFASRPNKRKEGRTVSDIAPEVATDDDVPGWVKLLITLALDVSRDILLYGMLLDGVGDNSDDLGLHLVAHVYIFYDGLGSPGGLGGQRWSSCSGHGRGCRRL